MELKLLFPVDPSCPEHDLEEMDRLKGPDEFENNLEWIVYQAKVFYEGFRDIGAATKVLEDGLTQYPENPDLLFSLAECYTRKQDTLEKAVEYCKKGLQIEPQSDYGYTIKARAEHYLLRHVDSYVSAMNALMINKHNFEAGVYLGVIGFGMALAEGNVEEMEYSLKNMRLTLSINPESEWFADILKKHEDKFEEYKRVNQA